MFWYIHIGVAVNLLAVAQMTNRTKLSLPRNAIAWRIASSAIAFNRRLQTLRAKSTSTWWLWSRGNTTSTTTSTTATTSTVNTPPTVACYCYYYRIDVEWKKYFFKFCVVFFFFLGIIQKDALWVTNDYWRPDSALSIFACNLHQVHDLWSVPWLVDAMFIMLA